MQLLLPSEEDYFDSGFVSSKEWVDLAASGTEGTDFDWLLGQLREKHLIPIWSQLYNAAEPPLVWNLGDIAFSKTRNAVPVRKISPRGGGMRAAGSCRRKGNPAAARLAAKSAAALRSEAD